jgi:hypothetical protein
MSNSQNPKDCVVRARKVERGSELMKKFGMDGMDGTEGIDGMGGYHRAGEWG